MNRTDKSDVKLRRRHVDQFMPKQAKAGCLGFAGIPVMFAVWLVIGAKFAWVLFIVACGLGLYRGGNWMYRRWRGL